MEAELKRLHRRAIGGRDLPRPQRPNEQTLVYPFDAELAELAATYARTPSRVLWDLYSAKANRLEPLYEELVTWLRREDREWLRDGARLSVEVRNAASFAAGPLQIRGTVKNAVIEAARERGREIELAPEDADLRLEVSGNNDELLIAVELGAGMHRRGYRIEIGEAPLKETLAAQMLMLARWDSRTEILIDPMCGAGTLVLEGAGLALGAPLSASDRTNPPLFADAAPILIGNEIHTPTFEALQRNTRRAEATDRVLALHGDFRDLSRARLEREIHQHRPTLWPTALDFGRGLVVCNPPYGDRLKKGRGSERELEGIYRDLWAWCCTFGTGWRAAFITDGQIEDVIDRAPKMKKPMRNGPLKCWFLVYEI